MTTASDHVRRRYTSGNDPEDWCSCGNPWPCMQAPDARPPVPSGSEPVDPAQPDDEVLAEAFSAGMFAGLMQAARGRRTVRDFTEAEIGAEFRDWLDERAAAREDHR